MLRRGSNTNPRRSAAMHIRNRLLFGPVLLALVAAAVMGGLLLSGQLTQATHGPTPTMAVDTEGSDNAYTLLARNNNKLEVVDIDQCTGVINSDGINDQAVDIDIVLMGAPNVVGTDIRLNLRDQAGNLLPGPTAITPVAEVAASTFSSAVAADGINPVGFLNLPVL